MEVHLHTVAVDRHTAEAEHTTEPAHKAGKEQVAEHTVAAAVQCSYLGEHIPEFASLHS